MILNNDTAYSLDECLKKSGEQEKNGGWLVVVFCVCVCVCVSVNTVQFLS
jgi:hypothetical protein